MKNDELGKTYSFWRLFFGKFDGLAIVFLAAFAGYFASFSLEADEYAKVFSETYKSAQTDSLNVWSETYRSDGKTKTRYKAHVTFTDKTGANRDITRTIGQDIHRRIKNAPATTVYYTDAYPKRVEFSIKEPTSQSNFLRFFALVPGVLCLSLLWFSGRNAVDAFLAVRFGQVLTGQVVGHPRSWSGKNEGRRIRLEWRSSDGHLGKSLRRPASDKELWPIGREITLFRGRKRDWWRGDVGDRSLKDSVPDVADDRE